MCDDALGVGDEDNRMRDTVAGCALREDFVEDIERLDDRRPGVGKQRQPNVPAFREPCERTDIVIADKCDIVAACREFLVPLVPGDRLYLAVRSPIQRAGEQQYQAGSSGQGLQAAGLAVLVGHAHIQGDRLADLETLIEIVFRRGGESGDGKTDKKRDDRQ